MAWAYLAGSAMVTAGSARSRRPSLGWGAVGHEEELAGKQLAGARRRGSHRGRVGGCRRARAGVRVSWGRAGVRRRVTDTQVNNQSPAVE